jgi:nucleoside-diphosphate-sugar epimerase
MKVLVTGGMGWIGERVVTELLNRGHEASVYDLKGGDNIFDQEALGDAMAGCDAVAHLAAIPHPKAGKIWEDYWKVNVAGTQVVARAALVAGVGRFVYTSSTAYYGCQRNFPMRARLLIESSPNGLQRFLDQDMPEMTPYNEAALCYICSKVAAEAVLAAYGYAGKLDVSILRFAPVTHTGEPWDWGLLTDRDRAAGAIADAVESSEGGYTVRNVVNPDVDLVGSLYRR